MARKAGCSVSADPLRACQRIRTRPLLHQVTSPAIAVRPEWALGAHLPFGVVDAFLMRAAYNSIGHDDRLGAMIPHELENFVCNSRICPEVARGGEPTLQCFRLGPLCLYDRNCSFARPCVFRAVERDGCDWIATKAASSFLLQGS